MTISKHLLLAPAALALLGVLWFVSRDMSASSEVVTPLFALSPVAKPSWSESNTKTKQAPELAEVAPSNKIGAILPEAGPTQSPAPIRAKIDGSQPGNSMIFGNLQISLIETVETGNPDETEYFAEISEAPKVREEVAETSAEQFRAKWGWNAYNQLQRHAFAEMQKSAKPDESL